MQQYGFFISFEGGEGAGKSTQIKHLAQALQERKYDVIITREPGGSAGAEAVRHVLLSGYAQKYGESFEAALFAAARADHIDVLIEPALKAGKVVLCDRFIDSTRVYQGSLSDQLALIVDKLEKAAIQKIKPDLTFILDLPAHVGLSRADIRRGNDVPIDRFEKDEMAIHEQRRQAFLNIARQENDRCVVIDAQRSVEQITAEIFNVVETRMSRLV